ncbi:MAG: hemerythrin domain-containing protein [Odoribacteraceae bacterium]|jgi:regulator of cell morphogenesis and NO signaling|nr:hemerythrin domain-containing protein [Odoribacteraceae bacterium]
MKHLLFSGKQKLSDLIHANYKLLMVLPRFNIKLGFEDQKVNEVCARYDISLHLFLMVCNVCTFEAYIPDKKETEQVDINGLILYLIRSHQDYRSYRIPVIKEQLNRLLGYYNAQEGKSVRQFFDGYSAEVINHLHYEEHTVFSYIYNLKRGIKSGQYHIKQFEKNHSNIEEKLHDLKNIIIKYLPEQGETELRNQILFNLFWLEEELNRHAMLEDRILIPFVQQLEERLNVTGSHE